MPVEASSPLTFGPTTSVRSILELCRNLRKLCPDALNGRVLGVFTSWLPFGPDEHCRWIAELL